MSNKSRNWNGATLGQGRYQVLAPLGEGAMGSTHRAHDRNLETEVIVKIPHDSALQDPDFAPRFDREIRALVKLKHPHIVKLIDVGNHDGIPYMVMEYYKGGDMDHRRPRRSDRTIAPMPPSTLAGWLPQIADALDHAHAKGYLHRDIKPTNILFDDYDHAYLADFGVVGALAGPADAPAATRAMTAAGLVLGTPEYMAPEILLGNPFDGRADEYSLAIMVYELLAGRRPFEGNSATALIVQQSTQAPPPIKMLVPNIPGGLAKAIHRALEKDPARRFENCSAFAKEAVAQAAFAAANASDPVDLPESRSVPCPSCEKRLKILAAYVGKKLRCTGCKAPLFVLDDMGLERIEALPVSAKGDSGSKEWQPKPQRPTDDPSREVPLRSGSGTLKLDRGGGRESELAAIDTTAKTKSKTPGDTVAPPVPTPPKSGIQWPILATAGGLTVVLAVVAAVVISRGPATNPAVVPSPNSSGNSTAKADAAPALPPPSPAAVDSMPSKAAEATKALVLLANAANKGQNRKAGDALKGETDPVNLDRSRGFPPLRPKVEPEEPETDTDGETRSKAAAPRRGLGQPKPQPDRPSVKVRPPLPERVRIFEQFDTDDVQRGALPSKWLGTLTVDSVGGGRKGFVLPDNKLTGQADIVFSIIDHDFHCDFEFDLPSTQRRDGASLQFVLNNSQPKGKHRSSLVLEFNAAMPNVFYGQATKAREQYKYRPINGTRRRVSVTRKGNQLSMTIDGEKVNNFNPMLNGQVDHLSVAMARPVRFEEPVILSVAVAQGTEPIALASAVPTLTPTSPFPFSDRASVIGSTFFGDLSGFSRGLVAYRADFRSSLTILNLLFLETADPSRIRGFPKTSAVPFLRCGGEGLDWRIYLR